MAQITKRSVKDLPLLPKRPSHFDDQAWIALWSGKHPLMRDWLGCVHTYSQADFHIVQDPRLTRQMATERLALEGVTSGPVWSFFSDAMLFANGPDHGAKRGPVARSFAFPLMAALRPQIRSLANDLVRRHRGAPQTDFLTDIAGALPAHLTAQILGLPPADIPHFTHLVYSAARALSIHPPDIAAQAAGDLAALDAYVASLFQTRRSRPVNDFLTDYLHRIETGPLSEAELRAQITLLILAGSDTTRGALAMTLAYLLQHPAQWALLCQDPEAHKAGAAAEGLRYDPIVATLPRIAITDLDLHGTHVPEGTLILSNLLSMLRDPKIYTDPDRFDITRTDHPKLHPVFGHGVHRCLGEALARIELEEALAAIATLAPKTQLAGPAPTLRGLSAVRQISPMTVTLA